MITLATIYEALQGSTIDAKIWMERGYLYIDSSNEPKIIRLSFDREERP